MLQKFSIMTKRQYEVSCERIEELLKVVGNETSQNDKNFIQLDFLSDLVADYEEKYFPIEKPSLKETLKLRMFEMDINQVKLSEILNVSPSRISEYLTGKSEPTLKVAREISKKLNIDASVILGV
ncbi:HTH-type transcriptional regulator / antitoxin HigA [Kaistella antarctica]|uniref:Predicted transcription regulator containing HTH domain n=2 Tax=Kaistella antarctica TaxID=266748 RepID=A0A3S4YUQ2_9FLAO|nr:HTH-type transcriptional regulator / antitoxin HigA [Kaistella antarctica]VEI01153.1 Predicted transcription regulator containing HTH domain [Kaistella antarctica]